MKQKRTFNAQAVLDSAGIARTIVDYRRAEVIFSRERCKVNHSLLSVVLQK